MERRGVKPHVWAVSDTQHLVLGVPQQAKPRTCVGSIAVLHRVDCGQVPVKKRGKEGQWGHAKADWPEPVASDVDATGYKKSRGALEAEMFAAIRALSKS